MFHNCNQKYEDYKVILMVVFQVSIYTFRNIPRTLGSTMLNLMIGHHDHT